MTLRPDCPRCGYDQSGVIATWQDSCPLAGLCSECGLTFAWSAVLNPEIRATWSAESGDRLAFSRFVRASLMAFRPRSLWRGLDLTFPIRPRRLRVFALIWLLIGHLVAIALVTVPVMSVSWAAPLGRAGWVRAIICPYCSEMQMGLGNTAFSSPMAPMYLYTHLPVAVMPVTLLIFYASISRIRVRKSHVWRALAYSIPLAVVAAWVFILTLLGEMIFETETRGMRYSGLISGAFMAIIGLGWPVWLALWWRRFLKDYLKLPRANWVALAMFIITSLLTVIVMVVYSINEMT